MANSAGMLKESIWRDKDFRALPRTAQATYAQLISQKELDRAGMLPLQISKWVKGCDEMTETSLRDDLKILEARRFIFIDEDTDELFIRSYMRHSEVTKYPQYLKAALRCAGMVGSEFLRAELAAELRKLRRADASKLADELNPSGTVPEPSRHGAETVPEPCPNPSGTVNPSGTLPEPSGVGERVGVVTSVGGSVGGARAHEATTDQTAATPDPNEPPPPHCPKHPGGTDRPCRACGDARERAEAWERDRRADAEVRRQAFLAELDACPDCDIHGWVENDDGEVTRCPNHTWQETAHA